MGFIGHKLMELCLASFGSLPLSVSLSLNPEPIRGSSFKQACLSPHPCSGRSVKSYAAVWQYSRESVRLISRFTRHGDGLQLEEEVRGKLKIISILLVYTFTRYL